MISYGILKICEELKYNHGIDFEKANDRVVIQLPNGHINLELKDNVFLLTFITNGYGYTRSFKNLRELKEHVIMHYKKQLQEKNKYVVFALDI
jgi:hypothetical protein